MQEPCCRGQYRAVLRNRKTPLRGGVQSFSWRFVSCTRRVEMRRDCDPATMRSTRSTERTKSMNADRVSDPRESGLSDCKKIPPGLNNAHVHVNPETDKAIFQPRCAAGS